VCLVTSERTQQAKTWRKKIEGFYPSHLETLMIFYYYCYILDYAEVLF